MGKVHAHDNGSVGPLKVFENSTATGTVYVDLPVPCRYFNLQLVKTSTNATLVMTGHLAPSSLSTAGVTLISVAASTSTGQLASTESTGPFSRLGVSHAAGASSGGLSCWISASP